MNNQGGIKKFEDLECWQQARELVRMIYQLTKAGGISKEFSLRDQIRRAAVSTMANIAEGFGAFSNPEFVRFLKMASRSCLEVQSHLYVVKDNDFVDEDHFSKVYNQAQRCANVIRGFMRHLRNVKK